MFIAETDNVQHKQTIESLLKVPICISASCDARSSALYLWLGCNRESYIFCLCAVNMEACAQFSFAEQQQASPHGV